MEYQDFERMFSEVEDNMEKYGVMHSEFQAEYDHLKEMSKTIFAALVLEQKNGTVSQRENAAYADEAYAVHLRGLKEARRKSLKAKALWELWKAKHVGLTCKSAVLKAQIQTHGG